MGISGILSACYAIHEQTDCPGGGFPRGRSPRDAKVGDARSNGTAGRQVWQVAGMTHEEAVRDGNPPLAGKTLIFEVRQVGARQRGAPSASAV
jgi:FKBP-type peptidyl-prolyl cis-trans isomerase 2